MTWSGTLALTPTPGQSNPHGLATPPDAGFPVFADSGPRKAVQGARRWRRVQGQRAVDADATRAKMDPFRQRGLFACHRGAGGGRVAPLAALAAGRAEVESRVTDEKTLPFL